MKHLSQSEALKRACKKPRSHRNLLRTLFTARTQRSQVNYKQKDGGRGIAREMEDGSEQPEVRILLLVLGGKNALCAAGNHLL
jgi:hypothetical protein